MSRASPRFRRPNGPLPPLTLNLYQANVSGLVQGQRWLTTLYYTDGQLQGAGVNPNACANAVIVNLPSWQPILGNNVTIDTVIVRCINNPTYVSINKAVIPTLTGTAINPSSGTIESATITRQTSWRGQAGRGRVNMPGLPGGFINATGESLNATGQAAYQTWVNTFFTVALTSGGLTFTPVLLSRGLRTQTPKVLGAAPVTGATVKALLGTTRRRKIGRGK